MSQNQYFRAGTGTVIYNDNQEIVVFSRFNNPAIWQFQQGGMDEGEVLENTLWRELVEETGLSKDDFTEVTPYENWTQYEYRPELRLKNHDPNCMGQVHKWYFLKIKPNTEINLNNAAHQEFADWRWTTFTDFLSQPDSIKGKVFQELANFFTNQILPTFKK